MVKFTTPYNFIEPLGEINTQPSQTIPDQSMTIAEIMQRYAQGLGYTGPKIPSYDGGDDPFDGINIATLDLSEKYALIEQVKQHASDLQKDLETQRFKAAQPTERKLEDNAATGTKTPITGTIIPDINPIPGKNSAGGD